MPTYTTTFVLYTNLRIYVDCMDVFYSLYYWLLCMYFLYFIMFAVMVEYCKEFVSVDIKCIVKPGLFLPLPFNLLTSPICQEFDEVNSQIPCYLL